MTIGVLDAPDARILMEVPADPKLAKFRLNACAKEPWTTAWIGRMRPGSTLLDVGACVGSYALLAAARGLRVVALEPGAENFQMLCRNVALNHLERAVVPLQVALGHENHVTTISYSDPKAGAASHRIDAPVGENPFSWVMQSTMDDLWMHFGLPVPQYILIDVDGGEMAVLRGARTVLSHPQCQEVMIEVPNESEEAVKNEITTCGFKMTERHDKRNNQPIGPLAYLLFARDG